MRNVKPIPCAWNSTILAVLQITDELGRAWVERRYPGRDGADWEDTGKAPESFQVEAVFLGATWLERLTAFRAEVEGEPGAVAGTFTHPFWGRQDGVLQSLVVTHQADRHDFARVTFQFKAGTVGGIAFSTTSAPTTTTRQASDAIAAATAALALLESA